MTRLAFETAETLIYDPVSANRTATRSALFALGFRRIETVATVQAFSAAIRIQPPDLAICEVQGAEQELCDSIQLLRQGASGLNPFIVIIVTAWEKSAALVGRVVNSGADDLILRPFSTSQLGMRIESHVERRKGFVITTDYVGPDRRKDPTRPANIELLFPPNSLKMKAKDRMTAEQVSHRLETELRDARDKLNVEKLRRDAFQICVLWRMMQKHMSIGAMMMSDLAKVMRLARGIERRCHETEFDKAGQWCETISSAVEGLQFGVDQSASLHLLGQAALNIYQVLNPRDKESEHLDELDATLAQIQARSGAKLAS